VRPWLTRTNDLDFGRLLALTYAKGPSVLQIRGAALLPEDAEELVVAALSQCQEKLLAGALVTIDESSRRVRILPIQ
jgi:predicted nuclease of predicted toxin-antitoxin system